MKIAIYTREFVNKLALETITQVLSYLNELGIEVILHKDLPKVLKAHNVLMAEYQTYDVFSINDENLPSMLVSIGGDGTILDTLCIVRDTGIPVLGINTGRLGFLAATGPNKFKTAIDAFIKGAYIIDERSLITLESSEKLFDFEFALNDFVLHKKDTSSMIRVHTYLNGEYFNSYWADGLICSTPTGSTGYNLSCGGPILYPKSSSFVITPIAPHNLNVRPFVIPDDHVLAFEIEGRSTGYLAGMDARSASVAPGIQMAVRKAAFTFNLIRLKSENFLFTLKDKMMWGLDSRN
jgi:NAD+ kinase